MLEHVVCLILNKERLTQEMRDDISCLADRIRFELNIVLENSVAFTELDDSSLVTAISFWRFQAQEDLLRFQKSSAHLAHLALLKDALEDKAVFDRSFE